MNLYQTYFSKLFCIVFLCGCYTHIFSQPNAPSDPVVLPMYDGTTSLILSWSDNSTNEEGFEIQRREEGGTFSTLTTVAVDEEIYDDVTATDDKMWEYRVRATHSTLGNSGWTAVSNASSPRQEWPIDDGDHNLLHTFGTPLDFSGNRYFHNGVDISASGKQVNAARGGTITGTDNLAGGQMWLNVDFGAGPEVDVYAHVAVDAVWGIGDFIAPGDRIGTVRDDFFNRATEADHVHWGDAHMHNLLPYENNADRDPNLQAPVVADINNDGEDFIVVNAASNDHNIPRDPAWGDVDFLVDAYDDMSADTDLMAAPFNLGYWIQSGVAGGENVRNSAVPYKLVQFDFPLHSAAPADPDENAAMYWPLSADIQGLDTWQSCLTWILTNTSDTDGAKANLDASQFWRTDARKGTGTEPNGSNALRARENQEARFPDGTYFVHIILEDLVNTTDAVRSVLVDNSRPYVRKLTVYSGLRIVYQSEWLWDGASAQLTSQPPDFNSAAAFTAFRTQDITIEVEFSEPMQSTSISAINPLGVTPTLTSTQPPHAQTTWRGIISNLDIADDGSDDGTHMITITGVDLAGNQLLQINNRSNIGPNGHNRNAAGNMQGTPGSDNIHGFRIGPLEGVIPITAIFMKQTATDPVTPLISDKSLLLNQVLDNYFEEVSYDEISFAVSGHGWYQLANPLDWYYTNPQTPLVDLVQEAVSAAEADGVSIASSDYVLVVTDETALRDEWSTNGAWPYDISASPGWKLLASGVLNLASSDARISNLAGRMVGLIDLFAYPEVTVARPFVGPWSHMSDKDNEAHVLGFEKWRVGWLDETGTATGNTLTRVAKPPVASPIVNQTHTISRLDNNDSSTKMVAVEIGDRLHYTIEYRRQQNLDVVLPDEGVLIVKANDYVNQGEGPAIVQESPVTAGDLSDAPFVLTSPREEFDDIGSGVNIEVTSMDADQAQIRLNYQVPPAENDVYVSPHDNRWKAEDIWIDAPDLAGNFEIDPLTIKDANENPVVGELNKVYGRVRNLGNADATNFEVHLDIREPWGAGGPFRSLKVETVALLQGQDTNPGDYHIIEADWTPSADAHACVKLTVLGVANDLNTENNWTQENIHDFVTSPGSPYAPITTRFEVENPFNETLPIFFKLDGLPPSWSYILSPDRLLLPAGGVGEAQVTIQPHDAAPLCSDEEITISAYAPRVDALKQIGAVTLQVALKNSADITLQTWVDCNDRDDKHTAPGTAVLASQPVKPGNLKRTCRIFAQGCTDPVLPNTQVAVIYTMPNGQKAVRYVTTDANGCYLDMLPVGGTGLWEVQTVLEAEDCRAEARSSKNPVFVPGSSLVDGRRLFTYSFHVGSAHPIGYLDSLADANINVQLDASYTLNDNLRLKLMAGLNQFTAESISGIDHPRWINASLNIQFLIPTGTGLRYYLQGGPGYYWPKSGSSEFGFNLGIGGQIPINGPFSLEFGADYHQIQTDKSTRFITTQLGVLFR